MRFEEVVREWVESLVYAARTRQLAEVVGQLDPRQASDNGDSEILIVPIEGLLHLTAYVKLRELQGDLDNRLKGGVAARWLYGVANARASGDLPFDEWRGIVDRAAGDLTSPVSPDAVRRVRALAILVSLVVPAGDQAALETDAAIAEGVELLREVDDLMDRST